MMIKSCVTISLVEAARGGPFVFWHDLPEAFRTARELGFDAVEIFPPSAAEFNVKQVRALLDEHQLQLAAVGTGAGWVQGKRHLCLPDPLQRSEARGFIRSIIDVAGEFNASAIIGSMQGRSGEEVDRSTALGYLADALEELGEYALQYNAPLIYEPLNRYETNLVNTVEAGVALLNSLSTKNVKLLADLFHMNIEEVDLAAALRAGGDQIGHVHFVDSNRHAAGFGHMTYPPIVEALRAIGYAGYASAEALPLPDSRAAAAQTMVAYREYF